MTKLLAFARTFNTLLPVLIVAVLTALTAWGVFGDLLRKAPTVNTVQGPGSEGQIGRDLYVLKPASIPEQGGVAFYKLVARIDKGIYEEGWGGEIRNLLVLKPGVEQASWLFPDQSLTLFKIVEIPDTGKQFKLLSILAKKSMTDNSNAPVDLYVLNHDGSGLTKVLENLDEVVGQTSYQEELRVIYQKDNSVRSARISLDSKKVISDTKLADLKQI
jgi:hypothetical protein